MARNGAIAFVNDWKALNVMTIGVMAKYNAERFVECIKQIIIPNRDLSLNKTLLMYHSLH